MKNKLTNNKKLIAIVALAVLVVILYIYAFVFASSVNLFSSSQDGPVEEITPEEVRERGGEVYYYGPDKIEVYYDPEYETPEQIEAMFDEWSKEENSHGVGENEEEGAVEEAETIPEPE